MKKIMLIVLSLVCLILSSCSYWPELDVLYEPSTKECTIINRGEEPLSDLKVYLKAKTGEDSYKNYFKEIDKLEVNESCKFAIDDDSIEDIELDKFDFDRKGFDTFMFLIPLGIIIVVVAVYYFIRKKK